MGWRQSRKPQLKYLQAKNLDNHVRSIAEDALPKMTLQPLWPLVNLCCFA